MKKVAVRGLAVVALILFAVNGMSTNAMAANDIVRTTLGNGLRVVIVRNTLAPVVTTMVNYIVGADETPPGFPGTAHAVEHMMFRGSSGLTADQLANIGGFMGGRFNADTRQTVTQYLFTVPAEDLDVALHIEALRMQDILATDKDWEQERGAIEQEVAADLSNPNYVLFTKLRAALFPDSVYDHDGLGTRPSFDKTSASMLKAFHDRWYAPNNAVLVIVGDLDPEATLNKVKDLFGYILPKDLPKRPDIKLREPRSQSLSLQTNLPYSSRVIAFRMPGSESEDYSAAQLLEDALNSQRGALYDLVAEGKALAAEFSYDPLPKSGLGYVFVAFPEGGDGNTLEKDVRDILAQVAANGIPDDLIEAAKQDERRSAEFEKNSITGLATIWSEAVAVDGLDSPDENLVRLETVTAADIRRVAHGYLSNRTTISASLTPQHSGQPIGTASFSGQETISLGQGTPVPLPDWAQSALGRLSVPASKTDPVVSTLANGITLIVQPEDISDAVSVYGKIRNRPELQVPPGKEGLSQVVGQLFSYGTKNRDRLAFAKTLDEIGVDEDAGINFSLRALSSNFENGMALLAENELQPAFPEDAFSIVRRQLASRVAGQIKSPRYQASRALIAALYPSGDPALREPRPETINALSLDDVRAYYREAFRPDLTTIVIIGNVTPARAKAAVERYFGEWTATGPTPATVLPRVLVNQARRAQIPDQSSVQARVNLAEVLGIDRKNPDYYALALGNEVLGGSFYATRLTRDLRKNAGLVYSVGSFIEASQTRAVYGLEYASDPQNVTKVYDGIVQELSRLQSEPISAEELLRAKSLLLRQIPLNEASVRNIAQGFLARTTLDLPLDEPTRAAQRYLELTPASVQAAFQKWIRPQDLVQITVEPALD